MKPIPRIPLPFFSLLGVCAIALAFAACAAGPRLPSGPTVTVTINSTPANVRIYADASRAGDTPTTVVMEVTEDGHLAYDVDITADYSALTVNKTGVSSSSGSGSFRMEPVVVKLKKGEIPPARIDFDNRQGTRFGQMLTKNDPSVISTAPGRIGSFEGIESSTPEDTSTAADTMAATPTAAASGGGASPGGGGAAGGGGRGGR